MKEPQPTELPIIFTCNEDCKNAQFASDISKVMDLEGIAQRLNLNEVTQSHLLWSSILEGMRPIMAIDGCRNECIKNALARYKISPTWHIVLSDFSEPSSIHSSFNYGQMAKALKTVQALLTSHNDNKDAPLP